MSGANFFPDDLYAAEQAFDCENCPACRYHLKQREAEEGRRCMVCLQEFRPWESPPRCSRCGGSAGLDRTQSDETTDPGVGTPEGRQEAS